MGLPIPCLLQHDDDSRTLLFEYVEGYEIQTPCSDLSILPFVVDFQDEFKNLGFPPDLSPCAMDGEVINQYRLDQLEYILGTGEVAKSVCTIYESFLANLDYCTIPFDRILHNAITSAQGLIFYDFEWTITGPYEFTLARIAVEFDDYDNSYILDRVVRRELYHLFLIRFYLYGREPETLGPFLATRLQNDRLRELFHLIHGVVSKKQTESDS